MAEKQYSKWMQTRIKNLGSYEAVIESLKKQGAKGGKAEVPKGFARIDRDKLIEVSRKGGSSKRK